MYSFSSQKAKHFISATGRYETISKTTDYHHTMQRSSCRYKHSFMTEINSTKLWNTSLRCLSYS